ncbi:Pycsar system effector family protein [Kribbella sp. NPDC051587]|uniref:Pycsar system effector family protein n=1 Tax=Kribbella sp. NPDC051587 TaxID=3364119 RepID=UPI0037BBCB8D
MAEDASETAWRLHSLLVEWIAKADSKATLALLVQSTVLGLLGGASIFGRDLGADRSVASKVLALAGVGLMLTAAACAALAVSPVLRSRKKIEGDAGIAYFGGLRSYTRERLVKELLNADLLPILSGQLIVLSDIAWSKFRWVRRSLLLGLTGAALLVIAAVVG